MFNIIAPWLIAIPGILMLVLLISIGVRFVVRYIEKRKRRKAPLKKEKMKQRR